MYDDICGPTLQTVTPFLARRPGWSAAGLLVGLALLAVPDAVAGPGVVTGPGMLLLLALAVGVGAWCSSPASAATVLVAAAALTAAGQLADHASYTVANDAVFFLVALGGPALVGATWSSRARQVRELQRLSAVRTAQVAADVRVARINEVNRLASALQHDVIQSLGGIVVRAEGARSSPGEAGSALADIEDSARAVLDQLRAQIGRLREQQADPPAAARRSEDSAPSLPRPPLGLLDLLAGLSALPLAVEAVTTGTTRGPAWANIVAALLLAGPLALRRRHPVPAAACFLVVGVASSAWLTPLDGLVSTILPLLLVAYAVGAQPSRRSGRVVGLALLASGTLVLAAAGPGSADAQAVLATQLVLLLAFLSGVVSAGRADRVRRLEELVAAIEQNRDVDVRLATARQRQALARDLHDSVAAAATIVCLHAGAARRPGQGRSEVTDILETITATARSGLREVRTSLELIDGPPWTGGSPGELTVADVVADARRAGLTVRVEQDIRPLPPAAEGLAARVVREGLVNAARHAAGAAVTVRVDVRENGVKVCVIDTGACSGAPTTWIGTGTGLHGLAERLEAHGGTLRFGPVDPRGFQLVAGLPLPARQLA